MCGDVRGSKKVLNFRGGLERPLSATEEAIRIGWMASPFTEFSEGQVLQWRKSIPEERIGPLIKLAVRNWPRRLYIRICP